MMDMLTSAIAQDGFAIIPSVLTDMETDGLADALAQAAGNGVRRRAEVYAIRDLLAAVPEVRVLARSSQIHELVTPILGNSAFAVRGILFDKTPEANWKVPWHQDLTIAVRETQNVEGFGPWSMKAGIPHVQPPVAVLERMLTVRIHLDECGSAHGPLQVLPGSHKHGRLTASEIQEWRVKCESVFCSVPKGGALLMRPLLLHASSAAQTPYHRRVVHLEFAAEDLPNGLCWHTQVR